MTISKATQEQINESSLGPLPARQMISDGSDVLGGTVTQVTLDAPDSAVGPAFSVKVSLLRVKITNLHATNLLAWQTVIRGSGAPTIDATPGATSGVIIAPGQSDYFTMFSNRDLYVVGSAADTSWSCSSVVISDQDN